MERKKQNMLTMQKAKTKKTKLKNKTKKGGGETTFLDECMGVETEKHGNANKDFKADGRRGEDGLRMHLRVHSSSRKKLSKPK